MIRRINGVPCIDITGIAPHDLAIGRIIGDVDGVHWVIAVELSGQGYDVYYSGRITDDSGEHRFGNKYSYVTTCYNRVPHPCEPMRKHDSSWIGLDWHIHYPERSNSDLYPGSPRFAPPGVASLAYDVMRVDSFFRFR